MARIRGSMIAIETIPLRRVGARTFSGGVRRKWKTGFMSQTGDLEVGIVRGRSSAACQERS